MINYCNLNIYNNNNLVSSSDDVVPVSDALNQINVYRKEALLDGAKHKDWNIILYSIIVHNEELDIIESVNYFKNTHLSEDELWELIDKFPNSEFGVLYANYHRKLCQDTLNEEKSKRIVPITLKEANAFVKANHRHHDSVTGCKFAIGLCKTVRNKDVLIGTAICGRPVSRYLDDGLTLEINRLCTTDNRNCCSMLYGACSRIAKEMGYKKIITYILESESGASLKASGFILKDDNCGGKEWTGSRKNKSAKLPPKEKKQRWEKTL